MSKEETFAIYSDFDVTGGSAAKYIGQSCSAPHSVQKFTLDAVKIAEAKTDANRVAKLCGWN